MVHQYKLNGFNIVIDVCSGSIHAVDEVAYDIISMFEEQSEDEICAYILDKYSDREDVTQEDVRLCISDVNALKNAGKLFTPDTFEPDADRFKAKSGNIIKALCLHVAHTCNLNCGYCFASQGNYHGDRGIMSFEVGKRALDFLVENSGNRTNLEVDFFGGEPLMNGHILQGLLQHPSS